MENQGRSARGLALGKENADALSFPANSRKREQKIRKMREEKNSTTELAAD
jgi:hypothetical protein